MANVVIYFLVFFIEAVILWQYSSILFEPKYRPSTRILVLCGLYLILFATSSLQLRWLNMALYLLANFIFLTAQYSLKWHSALFHSAILAAVMGMCELAVYSMVKYYTPHFYA